MLLGEPAACRGVARISVIQVRVEGILEGSLVDEGRRKKIKESSHRITETQVVVVPIAAALWDEERISAARL